MQTLCLFGSVLLGFDPPVAWFGSLLTTLAPYLPWLLWSLLGLLAILWIIVVTVQRQRVVGSFQDAWRTRVSHAHLRRLTHVQGNLETHVDQAFGELGKHVWQEQLTHPDYLAHFEQLAALFQQRTRFRGELAGIDAETQQILAQMQQIKADYTAQITTVQAAQQAQSVRLEALATTRRGVEKQRGRLLEQHHKAQNELKSMHERLRTLERSGSTEQAAQTPVLRSGMAALEETLAGLTAQESQAQAQMATLQDEQIALTATLRQYEQQGAELQASQQQALAPLERVRDDLHQQYNGPNNLDTHSVKVPYQMQMKKVYTAAFKAQMVLELLKEAKSINQLAAEHGVAPTVLREWKQAALTSLPDLFERRDSVTELRAAHARELEHLYAEIGRLTTHVNFLKKKLPD